MTFEVWYRSTATGRAPQAVDLDSGYRYVGSLEAHSLSEAVRTLTHSEPGELDLVDTRAPNTGDVLRVDSKTAWILTPNGIWARVDAYLTEIETT